MHFERAERDGFGANGVFGTAQIGYDFQVASRWVAGAFLDYDFGSSAEYKYTTSNASPDHHETAALDNKWTVGVRLGYLVTPDTLVYALAGYTQANFEFSNFYGLAYNAVDGSKTFSGYTVGGGLETALGGNFFLKGEYRYTDLGKETILSQPWSFDPFVATQTNEPSIHSFRAVLTYKFSGGDHQPLK